MTLDLNKPIQTINGSKVRILCTDLNRHVFGAGIKKCIVAAVIQEKGGEILYTYSSDGKVLDANNSGETHPHDLMNGPKRIKGKVCFYRASNGRYLTNFHSHDYFNSLNSHVYISCIDVDIKEGEGL